MFKFLTGLVSGVVVVILAVYIAVPQQTLYNTKLALEHGVWVEHTAQGLGGYNYTFGHGADGDTGYLPMQNNILALTSQAPVYTFDRNEIDRVCGIVSSYGTGSHIAGMTIKIYLTKEARNRLGQFLLSKPDEIISLTYSNDQINTFSVALDKVNTYLKNTNDPLLTADTYDPRTMGDFNIEVSQSSLLPGITTGLMIAGDKGFKHCDEQDSLETLPGFKEANDAYMQAKSVNSPMVE